MSLAGVEVDLSGFTPTTYAVDGGSRGAAPAIDAVGLSSFFVPADGVYRPGDEIYWFARFHKAIAVSGASVLTQRIGEEIREARYRPDVQTPWRLPPPPRPPPPSRRCRTSTGPCDSAATRFGGCGSEYVCSRSCSIPACWTPISIDG